MPYVDGIYVPDPAAEADVPADMLLLQQSLRGRIIRTYASTSARDTAVSALPVSVRQGARAFVPGIGCMTYVKASDPYDASDTSWVKDTQVKGDRKDSPGAEGNQMHRILASECFFDGAAPRSLTVSPVLGLSSPLLYVDVALGGFDGSGALVWATDRRTNTVITGAVAFNWIAKR